MRSHTEKRLMPESSLPKTWKLMKPLTKHNEKQTMSLLLFSYQASPKKFNIFSYVYKNLVLILEL